MYNNKIYWTVTESNILENDNIATQSYTFLEKGPAQAKLYNIWAYAADKPVENPTQCMSVTLMETRSDRNVLLESKVFDYRQPEPEPEPEPEQEGE